jgi:hypothetical protein
MIASSSLLYAAIGLLSPQYPAKRQCSAPLPQQSRNTAHNSSNSPTRARPQAVAVAAPAVAPDVKSRFVLLQQQRSGKQRQGTTASSIKAKTAGTTTGSSGGAVQSRTVKNADASIEIGHYIKERAAKARYATLTFTCNRYACVMYSVDDQ